MIDLGVDISEKQFLRAVKENPDVSIVCISSLLSTSIPEMEQVVKSLKRSKDQRKFKIMVGGGAVTRQLAKDMAQMPIRKTALSSGGCQDVCCVRRMETCGSHQLLVRKNKEKI